MFTLGDHGDLGKADIELFLLLKTCEAIMLCADNDTMTGNVNNASNNAGNAVVTLAIMP